MDNRSFRILSQRCNLLSITNVKGASWYWEGYQHAVTDEFLCVVAGCALGTCHCMSLYTFKRVYMAQSQQDGPLIRAQGAKVDMFILPGTPTDMKVVYISYVQICTDIFYAQIYVMPRYIFLLLSCTVLLIYIHLVKFSPLFRLHFSRKCTCMISNKLKINDGKTEFLLITSSRANFTDNINLKIGNENISPTNSCMSLGVMLDSHFTMDTQINNLCRATHFHLHNIAAIRDHLTSSATEQLIHSLVSSHLHYCNSLLYGVPKYKIKYLQRAQNIAARIVTWCPWRDHITPYFQSLHCLSVEWRIIFKFCFFLKNV